MNNLLKKPKQLAPLKTASRFQKFNLKENPFPSEPVVNKDSSDRRINGDIFEREIRKKEYDQFVDIFLKRPLADPNHIRLGYLMDTSYIGRGNGKSAFIVTLYNDITKGFSLDMSNEVNKCFAVIITPELGGRTKTFSAIVDLLFKSLINSDIIKKSLTILRLDAIYQLYPEIAANLVTNSSSYDDFNDVNWFKSNKMDSRKIHDYIFKNEFLQLLPNDFPIFKHRNSLLEALVSQDDFSEYYNLLKRGTDRFEFVFSHLVRFFQSCSFTGAFIFVDDFERIPDFQSARQKKDFALELRSCLYDGFYESAKTGFYNFILVFHAGVPRLISDSWSESGMENRSPIQPRTLAQHIIRFEKLVPSDASLLLKKYLREYRIEQSADELFPFTENAVRLIGEKSENNASKILKLAYELLNKASSIDQGTVIIDESFINQNITMFNDETSDKTVNIETTESVDLMTKAESRS